MQYQSDSIFDKANFNRGFLVSSFYKQDFSQFDMRHHYHGNIEIMYVLVGRATVQYTYDNVNYESVSLNANQYIFIDSNVKHKLVVDGPYTQLLNCEILLSDQPNAIFSIGNLYDSDEDFKMFINGKNRVFKALDNHFVLEMIQVVQKYIIVADKNDYSKNKASSLLSALLLCISSSYTEQFKNHKKSQINTAVNFIQNNYAETISMKDVASACHISCNYLNTLFKQAFFVCVTDYINKYRIKQACEKMVRSDFPINVLMQDVGFNNKMTFNRNFIKFIGTTPGQYRKNLKKKSYEINISNTRSNIF